MSCRLGSALGLSCDLSEPGVFLSNGDNSCLGICLALDEFEGYPPAGSAVMTGLSRRENACEKVLYSAVQ